MSLALLSSKNVLRNKFRSFATMAGVAVAILAFVLLRSVIAAWGSRAEAGARDRLATRNKITFVMTLPKRYYAKLLEVPGVQSATWMNWFGAKDMSHEREFFANIAVDEKTFLDVYPDVVVTPEAKQAWLDDRRGALVGEVLAKRFGWKVGDRVVLTGTIFPGDWELHVSGLYKTTSKALDKAALYFHWDYLNEALPARRKDQIGWIVSRIADASRSAEIAAAIDKAFDDQEIQTLSMNEATLQAQFMAGFSAVLQAVDLVSYVILAIMMLILGNTIAMGVRERTNEYGVLRAIGFMPGQIVAAILSEAAVIGGLGAVLGLAIAYPFISGLAKWVDENMTNLFPNLGLAPSTMAAAVLAGVALALVAAIVPAYRAFRLDVVSAIRRVG